MMTSAKALATVQTTAATALTAADNALADSNAQIGVLANSAGPNANPAAGGDAATLVAANAHADAGNAATLAAANTFTTTNSAATLASANNFATDAVNSLSQSVDDEFSAEDRHISRIGAMGTAMSTMAMGAGGLVGENRVAYGTGFENGQSAVALGFQHTFNSDHANVTIGGSLSNGQSSVGVGGGFSW